MGGISHKKKPANIFLYKNISNDGKAIIFNDNFIPVGGCIKLNVYDLKTPAVKQFIETNRLALIVKDIKTNLDVEKFISFSDFSKILKIYQKKEIKLLIIREGGLGDILLTTPILPELKKIIPHIHITYATSDQYVELLIDNPYIDEVSVWQDINKKEYDYILNLSQEVERLPERTSLDRVSLFCSAVGVHPSSKIPTLFVSKDDIDWADNFILKHFYHKKKKTIGICLESVSILRSYPQIRFKQLAQKLVNNKGIQVILLGEKDIEDWAMERVMNACGKTSIMQSAALIKRCDLVIGSDTGLLHVAGTLDIPILGLFGSEPPELRLVQYRKWEAIYLKNRLSCIPCYSWKDNKRCSLKNGIAECMDLITPQMIYEKAMPMLGYDIPVSVGKNIERFDANNTKKDKIKSILVKMTSGELGDKLVAITLMSEMRRRHPDVRLDIYLRSERFNSKDGYYRLFADCCDNCFVRESEITKSYDKIYEISAHGIHKEEIEDAQKGYLQISRTQRWARQLGFVFKGEVKPNYKIKKSKRIDVEMGFAKLKHPIIGISPLTSNRCKEWEPTQKGNSSKWQKVIDSLFKKKYSCVSFYYTSLKYNNCLNLGNLNPDELGYAISKLDLLIATEAGTTHFAGILGIPMIVLMGPSPIAALRHYRNVRIVRNGNCIECMRHLTQEFGEETKCGSYRDNFNSKCITQITPEEVIEMVKIFKGKEFKEKFNYQS